MVKVDIRHRKRESRFFGANLVNLRKNFRRFFVRKAFLQKIKGKARGANPRENAPRRGVSVVFGKKCDDEIPRKNLGGIFADGVVACLGACRFFECFSIFEEGCFPEKRLVFLVKSEGKRRAVVARSEFFNGAEEQDQRRKIVSAHGKRGRKNNLHFHSSVSIRMVTGPSFKSETFISAPKMPFSTGSENVSRRYFEKYS